LPDSNERRSIDLSVEDLGGFEVSRNEDEGLEAQPRSVCRNGVRQVAGGGAADGVEAKGLGIGKGDGDHAIFEAERGHADGVILDVQIAGANLGSESRRLHEWRKAGWSLRNVAIGDWQQRPVAPHVQGTLGDGFAGNAGARVLEVVGHLKRGKTFIADGKRLKTIGLAAFPTSQFVSNRHKVPRVCASDTRNTSA